MKARWKDPDKSEIGAEQRPPMLTATDNGSGGGDGGGGGNGSNDGSIGSRNGRRGTVQRQDRD